MTTTSAPPTSLRDCLLLVAFTVPVALVFHGVVAAPMFRAAKESASYSEAAYRKMFWSAPSLLLTWVPLLVGAVGNIGCSLLRDAGYLIFPWPLFSVAVLFGVAMFVCQRLRQRMIRRHFPTVG